MQPVLFQLHRFQYETPAYNSLEPLGSYHFQGQQSFLTLYRLIILVRENAAK